jgi:hypothetical protein
MGNVLHGADSSRTSSASDEVIDAIAEIEMLRRETQKEAGLSASYRSALGKLHELLDREKGALQQGPAAGQAGNIEVVTIEIEKLKGQVAATGGESATPAAPAQKKASWQYARRNPARNKTG